MKNPLVSVILPVYNAESFIEKAILSIQNQTYDHLEIIVIDDGSTDATCSIVCGMAKKDERIIFHSRGNKGLVYTLNELLSLCHSPFIARMDADDISEPDRIEIQLNTLLKTPGLAMVGSQTSLIDERGDVVGKRCYPTKSEYITTYLLYGNPIAHPTVMFNKNIVGSDLFYSDKAEHKNVEDIELWLRILSHKKIENISKSLLRYRLVSSSITTKTNVEQKKKDLLLRKLFWGDCPLAIQVCDELFIGCTEKKPRKIFSVIFKVLTLSFKNANVSILFSLNVILRALRNSQTADKRFLNEK